ncbi:MAG TPA: polysaccharide deacetylase family protein [Alphaproteobacteria bacterium]
MMSGTTDGMLPPGAGPKSGRPNLITGARRLPRRISRYVRRMAGRRLLGTVTHVITTVPVAALTFDDGPDPTATPRLLDILARHGAKATFFVLGRNAQRYPALIERIAGDGHAIANHSYDHPKFPTISRAERQNQIRACHAAIMPYGVPLFRPPFGLQTIRSRIEVALLGYDVVTWNACPMDWELHDADWFTARLTREVKPGSIVLLHDTLADRPGDPVANRDAIFTALDRFLGNVGSTLSFVNVPTLLKFGPPFRANWFVRSDDDWVNHNP